MLSLLALLPVLLLALAALGIAILQQVRPSIGYSWLIASLTGLLVVGIMFGLHWYLPIELVANQWRLFGELSSPPAFLLDQVSWPYAFCLVVLALASVLTDSARLELDAHPIAWVTGLGLTAIALLAVMAGNLLTLVMTWTAVDLIELLLVLSTDAGRRMIQQTVTAFSVRFTGTLIVILAILFARSQDISVDLNPIADPLAIFMLLAVGLRLGVLPLNLLYSREVYTNRGSGNIARMIGPASSLMVLGQMPVIVGSPGWQPVLLGFSALAAIYGSSMWLASDNELYGRPYWSIALAALAIASVLNGSPNASIAWGAALLLAGSLMFLFTAQRRGNPTFPLLGLVGLTGLPFTLAAGGWIGVTGGQFSFYTVVFLLSVVLLIWGYLRHTFHPRDELHRMQRWVHAVYPTGLVFLITAQWIISVFGWPGSFTIGVWWASLVVFILAGSGVAVAYLNRTVIETSANSWLGAAFRRIGAGLGAFFGLNWLYGFLAWVYHAIQAVIQLLTSIFEGDGGFLWSMVLLALLLSIALAGGQP